MPEFNIRLLVLKLVFLMNRSDYNQSELAKEASLAQSTISCLFTGRTQNPTLKTFFKLAVALEADVVWLLGLDGRKTETRSISQSFGHFKRHEEAARPGFLH